MNICITGASAGIGEATLHQFAQNGHKVYAIARRKEKLDQLKQLYPESVVPIQLDVSDREAVGSSLENLPIMDVLINNAGLALGLDPAYKANLKDWEIMIQTNILGVLYITHALLPKMVERRKGLIINIGSVAGTYPYPGGNIYGATKAFIHQLTLNLKTDLLGQNIRVTSIEPGVVHTDFSETRFKGDKEKAQKVYENIRCLTPEDIAQTIFWLSQLPDHININYLEIMPTDQASGPFQFFKEKRN